MIFRANVKGMYFETNQVKPSVFGEQSFLVHQECNYMSGSDNQAHS